ncbi:MAG TPA: ribosome recycling factor [Gammaproteobacteria bacterium]|jgi:ribosome recycling factor|nr:ribosome recycling factor [Gammaproteobacteria bacterium]
MIQDIRNEADGRMGKSIESLQTVFARIRTGRANANLLDGIQVNYYGVDTPLNQLASVSVEDSRTLAIVPWEKKLISEIEKAILKSDLGLNPSSTSEKVRIPLPALTEENRKDLIKQARGEAEQARVAVRSIRRDAMADIKALQKDKLISEDDARRGEEEVQKLTDRRIAEVDKVLSAKEADLMVI